MVFEKVREIICDQLDVAEDDVTMESNIADDLGADSLDVVDLVMSLEEEFDAEFPENIWHDISLTPVDEEEPPAMEDMPLPLLFFAAMTPETWVPCPESPTSSHEMIPVCSRKL